MSETPKYILDFMRAVYGEYNDLTMGPIEKALCDATEALAEKDREIASLAEQLAAANAEVNRLRTEGHEYRAIAENANASLVQDNAVLKARLARYWDL